MLKTANNEEGKKITTKSRQRSFRCLPHQSVLIDKSTGTMHGVKVSKHGFFVLYCKMLKFHFDLMNMLDTQFALTCWLYG